MQLSFGKRRSFLQHLICFFGGVTGASALQRNAEGSTEPVIAISNGAQSKTLKFQLTCRHLHGAGQSTGRVVCRGELTQMPDAQPVGEFFSNCFCAESSFGYTNPFASSNVELHTIRFSDGTLFGMGANSTKGATERVHAILGGTGRFAGARGTYVIAESTHEAGSELTITLLG